MATIDDLKIRMTIRPHLACSLSKTTHSSMMSVSATVSLYKEEEKGEKESAVLVWLVALSMLSFH